MGQIASLFGIALKAIYGVIGNYGLSIIVFTIIVKLILMPLTVKTKVSTRRDFQCIRIEVSRL